MKPDAYTEEFANSLTHAIGVCLSIAGGAFLVVNAVVSGSASTIIGVSVFAASLVLMYVASTTFHAVRAQPLKYRLQVVDHCAIYVLIAGTYTPFLLGPLRSTRGSILLAVMWGLTVAGIIFKLFFTGRFRRVSTAIYLAMGWMALIAAGPLWRQLQPITIAWLAAGGIIYTVGTVFYHSPRRYHHAVWHVFVLTGSLCHGMAVAVQILDVDRPAVTRNALPVPPSAHTMHPPHSSPR